MWLKQKYFNFIFMVLAVQYVILYFVMLFMGHHKNVKKIHNKIIEDFQMKLEDFIYKTILGILTHIGEVIYKNYVTNQFFWRTV